MYKCTGMSEEIYDVFYLPCSTSLVKKLTLPPQGLEIMRATLIIVAVNHAQRAALFAAARTAAGALDSHIRTSSSLTVRWHKQIRLFLLPSFLASATEPSCS